MYKTICATTLQSKDAHYEIMKCRPSLSNEVTFHFAMYLVAIHQTCKICLVHKQKQRHIELVSVFN